MTYLVFDYSKVEDATAYLQSLVTRKYLYTKTIWPRNDCDDILLA